MLSIFVGAWYAERLQATRFVRAKGFNLKNIEVFGDGSIGARLSSNIGYIFDEYGRELVDPYFLTSDDSPLLSYTAYRNNMYLQESEGRGYTRSKKVDKLMEIYNEKRDRLLKAKQFSR